MNRPSRLPLAGRLQVRGHDGLAYRLLDRVDRTRYLRRLPCALPDDAIVVRQDGRLIAARIDAAATGRAAARDALELAIGACEQAAIDYFLVPEVNEIGSRLAIPDAGWVAFAAALETLGRAGLVGVLTTAEVARSATLAGDPAVTSIVRRADAVSVFCPVVVGPDGHELGRGSGCRVERWASEGGRLSAPDSNGRAAFVEESVVSPVIVTRDGVAARSLDAFTTRQIFEVDFPIDVVYTWVDGSDPAWRARKDAALASVQGGTSSDVEAADESRFRDGGELRYSLRSLSQYAPWVRRVFLVTDRQVPSWLELDEPRLTVVDHRELFGEHGALPTFNSHAIGARLHHLDGLAEHYLYFNDDFFLGHDVTPGHFFEANGTSKFFLSRSGLGVSGPDRPPHESARHNVAALIERDFGCVPTNIFYHSPIPQRRSTMAELERRYPDEFRTTINNPFRSHDDIEPNAWLHHYAGYLLGRTVPAAISYTYAQLDTSVAQVRLRNLERQRDRAVFCINDDAGASPEQRAFVAAWLERYFPVPSPFEKH